MSDKPAPSFLPRPGDLPRADLMRMGEQLIRQYGGPKRVEVHFKFTCPYCGTRCTLQDANVLPERGECAECGETTEITMGGVALQMKL